MKKLGNTIDVAAVPADWLSSFVTFSAGILICTYDLICHAAVAKLGA